MNSLHYTTSDWATFNPVLSDGQLGVDSTTKQYKVGDGYSKWLDLSYYDVMSSVVLTSGSVPFITTNGYFTQDNSKLYWDNTNKQLGVGINSFIATTGNILNVGGTNTASLQVNIQNTSTGTSASSDIIATSNTGTNLLNYVDVGINSSTYNDSSYTSGGANDSYLLANGGNLGIITATATKTIGFYTGGTLVANQRATIDDTGLTVIGEYKLSALNTAPATASSTGTLGEIRITATGIFVCTATNTWVKAALATF
jgi:hypothetical protein